MPASDQPITLGPDVIRDLAQRLSDLRHNTNNHLSLIIAAVELIKRKPEAALRMVEAIADQPGKITEEMNRFSDHLEAICGIIREG